MKYWRWERPRNEAKVPGASYYVATGTGTDSVQRTIFPSLVISSNPSGNLQ